jgi:acetyl esterase/lipase
MSLPPVRPALAAVLLLVSALAPCAAAEATPEGFPGAETFAFRDGPDRMTLHVVKPEGWKSGDRRGALLFFFGGGWTRGTPEASIGWARSAAKLGLVGVAPDYRTKDRHGVSPLGSVADARAALRWVQDHAAELGIDPARIAVGGNSAGGHVALWTALSVTPPGSDPAEAPRGPPAALVLFSAVSDTSAERGYTPQRFGAHTRDLSPIHHLDARMPPVLMFHGDADQTVPYAQAVALDARLREGGNASRLVTVPGGRHSIGEVDPSWRERSRGMVVAFLRETGVAPAAPTLPADKPE